MKSAKVLFIVAFLAVAMVFALFEYGVLPVALVPDTPENRYAVDVACIFTGVGGFFILLTILKIPAVRAAIHQPDGVMAEKAKARYCNLRMLLWMVLILFNAVMYYEAPMTRNPTYCVLMLFVAGVFCWPKTADEEE